MAKDLFSEKPASYAKYRPGYPEELIAAILDPLARKEHAWDCATGNGQAAILLSPHFRQIEATDISAGQLAQATPHPAIHYSVSTAEKTSFDDDSFDLITVAQAYHWLDPVAFHHEATRTGKRGALVAIWGYGLVQTKDTALGTLIQHLYTEIVGPYWDPERKHIDHKYETVVFPFTELPHRSFKYGLNWTRSELLGYLATWSSVGNFIKKNGYDPLEEWSLKLKEIWQDEDERPFSFPLFLRRGIIEK